MVFLYVVFDFFEVALGLVALFERVGVLVGRHPLASLQARADWATVSAYCEPECDFRRHFASANAFSALACALSHPTP